LGLTHTECPSKRLKLIGKLPDEHRESSPMMPISGQLHCPGIGRNTDDWAAVSVGALYGATAYAGKTRLKLYS